MTSEPRKYKETKKSVVYQKDFYTPENNDWISYPKNRISIVKVEYNWQYKDRNWAIQDYEWVKYRLTNCKLENDNWDAVKSKKAIKTRNWDLITVDDKKEIDLTKEYLEDILLNVELD